MKTSRTRRQIHAYCRSNGWRKCGSVGGGDSGGREPEGAGPSLLNSVSDSNMCPTENRHFLPSKSIFLSLSISESISLSLPVYF